MVDSCGGENGRSARGWSGRWVAVVPRADVVGDAAVRGTVQPGYAAGPVAYREGGALGFGGVPLREPDD